MHHGDHNIRFYPCISFSYFDYVACAHSDHSNEKEAQLQCFSMRDIITSHDRMTISSISPPGHCVERVELFPSLGSTTTAPLYKMQSGLCSLSYDGLQPFTMKQEKWKKIEKVEKVSLFFHESWCIMMYHPFTISVSCHHDLHLHPSGLGHGMRILNGRWIPLHLSCWLQKSTWAVQSWACRVAESGVPVLIANKTFLWSQVQVGLKPLWENWWVQDSLKLRYSISSGLKDGWSLFNNSVMTLASNKLTWSGRAHLSALPVGNRLQDPIFPLAHRPPERSRRVRISNLNVNVCRV